MSGVGILESMGGKRATFPAYPDDDRQDRRKRQARSAPNRDWDTVEDADETEWDDVADVICDGRGRLGIAVAVAARRVGLDVMLADAPAATVTPEADGLAGHLGITDDDTAEYLRALTEDFTPLPAALSAISTREVDGPLRPELPRGRIGTFYGAALRDWGMSCMSSRYGLLYTRVADPRLSVTYTGAGGAVEATVLDTIDIDPERPADSLEQWLSAFERDHGDEIPTSGVLQRLVFDNGVVVGAVLESAGGVRMVRARHGVMLSLGEEGSTPAAADDLNVRETAEVALVSRAASRFARLELLTRSGG